MRDNVDHRLLERFRALQRANSRTPVPQPTQKRAAAAGGRRPLPALDLRD
jgi:hypothetical protein